MLVTGGVLAYHIRRWFYSGNFVSRTGGRFLEMKREEKEFTKKMF